MNGSISTYLKCAVYSWAPKFHFSLFESNPERNEHHGKLVMGPVQTGRWPRIHASRS